MPPVIEIVQPARFDGAVADEIVASIQDFLAEKGSCSVVLSGGKTPSTVYRTLAIPPRVNEIEWSKVRLFLGDDRWVPSDDLQSNYRMVLETLISKLPGTRPELHSIDTSASSPTEGARQYESAIRKSESLAQGEIPQFDLVLLGIGADGHTASILPGATLPKSSDKRICTAVGGHEGYEACVTMAPEVLFSAKRILFIVKGDAKADIVQRVLEGEEDELSLPAVRYRSVVENVTFFLDSGAAQKLDRSKLS